MRHLMLVLGLALVLTGCTNTPATKTGTTEGTPPPGESHDHEKGPHGGPLFATADHKYHLEVVVKDGQATVYLLDGEGKKAVSTPEEPLKMTFKGTPPVTVTLTPDRDTNDPKGETTRFKGSDKLPENADLEKAEISGKVKGKDYVFEAE